MYSVCVVTGCTTQIENALFKEVRKIGRQETGVVQTDDEVREPLSCIRRAQVKIIVTAILPPLVPHQLSLCIVYILPLLFIDWFIDH